MNSVIWSVSYLCDVLFALWYFRRREDRAYSLPRRMLGLCFLLATYILYPSGLFPLLSNSVYRFALRTALFFAFLMLSRPIPLFTAFYAAAYWSTVCLLLHNIFFAPAAYQLLSGSVRFAANGPLNQLICALLIAVIKAAGYLAFSIATPLTGMSPVEYGRILYIVLIPAIGIYGKELEVPLMQQDPGSAVELSRYYILLQAALLALLGILEHSRRQQRERSAMQLQAQVAEALVKSIQDKQESDDSLRRLRHDLKNHMLTLRLLLERQEIEPAQQYIDDFLQKTATPARVYHTGHALLDGLLRVKLDGTAENGIEVRVSLDFSQGGFISNFDLCVILGNLLDNAVEGCLRVTDAPRFISITGAESAHCLLVRISNSCREPLCLINGLPNTMKADRERHGYGLRNVERTVNRYHGSFSLATDASPQLCATATILIPIPDQ